MKKTIGHSDDMLIVKGFNVFPSQIDAILFSIHQEHAPYQIIADRKGPLDTLNIRVKVTNKIFALEMQRQRAFLKLVKKRVKSVIGIDVRVNLVEPMSLPRQDGKIIGIVDQRQF